MWRFWYWHCDHFKVLHFYIGACSFDRRISATPKSFQALQYQIPSNKVKQQGHVKHCQNTTSHLTLTIKKCVNGAGRFLYLPVINVVFTIQFCCFFQLGCDIQLWITIHCLHCVYTGILIITHWFDQLLSHSWYYVKFVKVSLLIDWFVYDMVTLPCWMQYIINCCIW